MQQQKEGFSLGFSLLILLLACYSTSSSVAISLTSATEPGPEPAKCKDEGGKDVDWFMVYKLPKNRISSNPLVRAGLAYAYILPSTSTSAASGTSDARTGTHAPVETNAFSLSYLRKGSYSRGHPPNHHDHEPSNAIRRERSPGTAGFAWILSEKGIDSPGSMVGQTLGKLYSNKKPQDALPVAFLTYSDQPPVGPTASSGGHSKGVVLTNLASGFWIQHSVPHFPLIQINNPHYQYPDTGRNNGQIFHCISLPSIKDVDNLGRILNITMPHIANSSFPTDAFKSELPQLMAIVNRHRRVHEADDLVNGQQSSSPCVNEIDEEACLNEQLHANAINLSINRLSEETPKDWDQMEFRSAGGNSFQAFIKGPSLNEEIYSARIAPKYKTQLLVQSWLNGPNPYPSNCTFADSSVFNIIDKSIAGTGFSTHSDHSKWAISVAQPLVCISDLNRMEHQRKRGGVTVCFMDARTWSTFNSSIIDVQPCPRFSAPVDHHEHGIASISHHPSNNLSNSILNGGGQVTIVQVSNITRAYVDDRKKWTTHNSFHQKRRQRKVKSRTYSFGAV